LLDINSQKLESSFEIYFIDSEENGAKTYNYGMTSGGRIIRTRPPLKTFFYILLCYKHVAYRKLTMRVENT